MGRIKNQVLQHLKHASSWLNKAEKEFEADDPVKAEITLSLAQAEVKKAWEVSMIQRMAAYTKHKRISGWSAPKLLKYAGVLSLAIIMAFIVPGFIKDNEPARTIALKENRVEQIRKDVSIEKTDASVVSSRTPKRNIQANVALVKSSMVKSKAEQKPTKENFIKETELVKVKKSPQVQQVETSLKNKVVLSKQASLSEDSDAIKKPQAEVKTDAQEINNSQEPSPTNSNMDNVDMVELVRLAERKLVENN